MMSFCDVIVCFCVFCVFFHKNATQKQEHNEHIRKE